MEWPTKKLCDVLDIQNGYAFDSKKFSSEDGMPLIRIRDISNGLKTVTNYAGEYKSIYVVRKGDFLIGMDGEFRCYEWKGEDALLNQRVCRLQNFSDELSARFLSYGINKYLQDIEDVTGFTTVKHISASQIKNIEFPLPPIPEQQRIVAILDQAFADIEKARANAEKNLKNARELFDSYLNQVFSQRGEGWVEEVLGRVCDVRDGTHDSPKYVDEGIPFITQKNIRTDGLSFEKTKFISETDHMKFYKRSNVTHGDILISMIGINRGMACVVDDHRIFSIKNVGLIKKALNINPLFLLFYLKSHTAKKYIESESRGGAQPFIGLTKLRAFPVLLASPEEQEEVVSKLTLIEARTENLVLIYETKLKSLDELKKSLLQKAFSGELTKTEDMVA